MKLLIIIPAYNEEKSIDNVISDIENKCPQYDYVIINDGSGDSTAEICKKKGYSMLDLPINLGIGGAVQTGYRYALTKGYDYVVQIDGDGQHDVAYIDKLLGCLTRNDADIVIGSRYIEKQGFQSTMARRMGINFLSGLIKVCTGKKIYDVTSGFRLVNKKFINYYAENYPMDYPEPEAIVMALECGAKVLEEPVIMKERQAGESSIKKGRTLYYMIKVSLAIIICRISLGVRR